MKIIKYLFKLVVVAIGSLLALTTLMAIMIAVFVSSMGVFDEAIVVEDDSVLVIDLSESIVDNPAMRPLSLSDMLAPIEPQVTLLNALVAIELAAEDDNIKGILIRPNGDGALDMASLEELRSAIMGFKESGKFVLAYDDDFAQRDYYLASVADEIYIQPLGSLAWQGISTSTLFFKGLLDKLDVSVEVFRPEACSYKSAVEPLTRSSLSAESRAQSRALVESIWGAITSDVASSRNISVGELNEYADNLSVTMPAEAHAARMVDGVIYEDELYARLEELEVEIEDGAPRSISLGSYVQAMLMSRELPEQGDRVAIIYAEGTIVDGEGAVGEVGGDALAATLREAREDDDIKAVVVRINSPGGSALAAEVAWREMVLLKESKPVIISMGGYAASGGYYISAPADMIIADRTTITGSIGVFGLMLNSELALKDKLGITTDGVGTNRSSDFMQRARTITSTERKVVMRSVDHIYEVFMDHVSVGRNLDTERVASISRGRVYSGIEAEQVGLVDAIGGLKYAIAVAKERAGCGEDITIKEMVPEPSPLEQLLTGISASVSLLPNDILKVYSDEFTPYLNKNGVVMHTPLRVNL